jgi:SEC-C motif
MSDEPVVRWYPTFRQIRRRKVEPTDPCPCLSGLKFQTCCGSCPDTKIIAISPMERNQS